MSNSQAPIARAAEKIMNADTVELRFPEESDYPVLLQIKNDRHLQTLLVIDFVPYSLEDVGVWLKKRMLNPTEETLVISDDANNCLGFIQLNCIDSHSHNAFLGICIHPDFQGHGVGKRAVLLMHHYASIRYKTTKMLLEVSTSNRKAIKVYEDIGYSLVGVLKKHRFASGEYYDLALMEMLIGER